MTHKYRMRFYELNNTLAVRKSAQKQIIPSTAIPDQTKRDRIIPWLTAAITRLHNVPHVTKDDVALATKRFQRDQKRANLAYEKDRKSHLR